MLNSTKHEIYQAHIFVGIFTFISMIHMPSERLKARSLKSLFQHFSLYEQFEFNAQLS